MSSGAQDRPSQNTLFLVCQGGGGGGEYVRARLIVMQGHVQMQADLMETGKQKFQAVREQVKR